MIKKITKFLKWFFSNEGGSGSVKEWREVAQIIDDDSADKIFAEMDNDLIRQIDKAEKDFKQAQLRHIPCRILYYDKHIVKLQIKKIKAFLVKGFENESVWVKFENHQLYSSGSWHDNKHYIKYKGK